MLKLRRYFRSLAMLSLFLIGTWMSNAAVAMPQGISCVEMHGMSMMGMSMVNMPCCRDNPGMDMRMMDPHSEAMSSQCMAICAQTHAPGGLRFSGISVPTPVWIGSVTWTHSQFVAKDRPGLFSPEPSYHPPPLLHVRLTI